jgi:DNA-directed RNA polymerase specialized sigma24 family protein
VISIDDARQAMEGSRAWESDAHRVNTILSLIDVDRALENDGGRRHGARDRLVFKLHYVDGFTSAEIAAFPGFQMGRSAVEAVLSRMRKQARG